MKILMVNKFLYRNGGSETYMLSLGEELARRGHQVEYFGMEHEGRCVANHAEAYTQDMDFHNSNALQKLKLSLKTIYSKEARKKIRLVLDDFCPDVVHLNNFNYQLTPSVILEIRKWEKESGHSVKIIYTAHDYQLICPNHMLFCGDRICEQCMKNGFLSCTKGRCIHGSPLKSFIGTREATYWNKNRVYEQLDTVICCSAFMKKMLDTNPVFREKTITMHNFTDKIEAEPVKKEDYVLYFGRYSKEKGIETILKAKDIRFICAGSGDCEDELNAQKHITNVGFKSGKELADLIRKAKCSVYPSIWYENCPFSVMESIMHGTPVVASKIGGIPELIANGKTGILVEPNDPQALTAAVKEICEDDEKAAKMSESCLSYRFDTVEEYTEKLLKIYANTPAQ